MLGSLVHFIQFIQNFAGSRRHFMDSRVSCEEVSEELTRELLIAISYSVPEKAFDLNLSSETFSNVDGISVSNGDVTDHYRSELISISSVQSSDVKI